MTICELLPSMFQDPLSLIGDLLLEMIFGFVTACLVLVGEVLLVSGHILQLIIP